MALRWTLHDLKSGALIDELPLSVSGSVEKTIGEASSLSVSLAVHSERCPANWATLIDPMRAMFILDDGVKPVEGYYISETVTGEPSASFTLTSLEGILGETYCRTHDFTVDDDECQLAATLLADVVAPSFGFEVATSPDGKTPDQRVDRSYSYEEDQTVGDAIGELSKSRDGLEWTVRLRWEDGTRQRIIKTIVLSPKVGSTIESVVVENKHLDGSRLRRGSFSRGNRATHVIASGDGSGEARSMSAAHVDGDALDSGVPQWEVRLGATGVEDDAQLDSIATAGLMRRRNGVQTWEMSLSLPNGAPRPGRDFNAGDTVTIDSAPTEHDPSEWRGLARIIGWRADIQGDDFRTVTPVFYVQPEEFVS